LGTPAAASGVLAGRGVVGVVNGTPAGADMGMTDEQQQQQQRSS